VKPKKETTYSKHPTIERKMHLMSLIINA